MTKKFDDVAPLIALMKRSKPESDGGYKISEPLKKVFEETVRSHPKIFFFSDDMIYMTAEARNFEEYLEKVR